VPPARMARSFARSFRAFLFVSGEHNAWRMWRHVLRGLCSVGGVACTGAATAGVLAALAPAGLGRWDYYRLLAAGNMAQVAGCALVGVLLGLLGGDARRRWPARLTAGLGLASALIAAGFVGALAWTARSHGLSLGALLPCSIGRRQATGRPTTVSVVADDGLALLADLYRPPTDSSRRAAIVVVHGGAWRHGDKGENPASNRWLAERGYTVLDIRYRLAPVADWRIPVADVWAALAWLRANAAALDVEPTRIALLGRSAGGHLALLAAYMDQQDAPPAAVIAFYAPTDLGLLRRARHEDVRLGLHALVGTDPDGYRRASPLSYASRNVPPTLLIQGTWDNAVVPEHSRRLARELGRQGANVTLLEVPFARHAFDVVPNGLPTRLAHQAIGAFLERELTPEIDGTRRSNRAERPARR
jgi:acetyl esterase/lipase